VRIGELARRTGVPARLLRYYEEQELLVPDRSANGYRDYGESLVDRVVQIRGLLDAGLTTRIIRQILPCLDDPCTIHVADATPELIAALECHRAQMDTRIRCLSRNRDAISGYLAAVLADPGRSVRCGRSTGPPTTRLIRADPAWLSRILRRHGGWRALQSGNCCASRIGNGVQHACGHDE
jgi:DNA-binding transcriptional MerR regulator